GSEEIVRLAEFSLIAPKPGETHGCAQLPPPRTLAPSDRQGLKIASFDLMRIRILMHELPFAAQPMQLGLEPALLSRVSQFQGLDQYALRLVHLASRLAAFSQQRKET